MFDSWVAAQPELHTPPDMRRARKADRRVVLMVLVASHGGGIRAAYWTGLALDCLVAATPVPPGAPNDLTCSNGRRSPAEAARAARRIFVASGVSGGAVGLQAYARELLGGGLRDGWVEKRLGSDFASPTVAWGLFHDLPNHLVGSRRAREASAAARCSGVA